MTRPHPSASGFPGLELTLVEQEKSEQNWWNAGNSGVSGFAAFPKFVEKR